MTEYKYLQKTNLETINQLTSEAWSIIHIEKANSESFDLMLGKNLMAGSQTLIINEDTGAEFFIDKSVSYGDILVVSFLMLFLIFGVMKFILNFFIPKLVNFKR